MRINERRNTMRLKCPHCGISGKASPLTAGRLVRCPRCTELFLLPEVEEPPQAPPFAELFGIDTAVLPPTLVEDGGQEDRGNVYEPGEQESGEPVEENLLADESWLTEEFQDDPVSADLEDIHDVNSEVTDGNLGKDEIEESEELLFDETFGEELAESFKYQDITDTISSSDTDSGGFLDEEDPELVEKSNYPDFTDTKVSWKEEQLEPETAGAESFHEQKAEQIPDDEDVFSSQPSGEAIQQDPDEVLVTTCVACDNQVAEDELYCPDCLKKKAAGTNPSAALTDDGACCCQIGETEKDSLGRDWAVGRCAHQPYRFTFITMGSDMTGTVLKACLPNRVPYLL